MADQPLKNNEQGQAKVKEIYDLARKIAAELHAEHHRPAVRFTLEAGEPGLFESKAGGTPYLPHDMAWPLDGKGVGMYLLAQIDCAGLAGLPDFPDTGLLQFFIAWDDVYGADFNQDGQLTDQSGFRVLWHETVDRSVTAGEVEARRPSRPAEEEEDAIYLTPLWGGPYRIVLRPVAEQGLNEADGRFNRLFTEQWNRRCPEEPIRGPWEIHRHIPGRLRDYSATDTPGWHAPYHQLGGYPYFTQDDPRPGRYDDLDVLLFQLDSDMRTQAEGGDLVLWGDAGVGNFFINREALRRRDFSRVAYTWDCG